MPISDAAVSSWREERARAIVSIQRSDPLVVRISGVGEPMRMDEKVAGVQKTMRAGGVDEELPESGTPRASRDIRLIAIGRTPSFLPGRPYDLLHN